MWWLDRFRSRGPREPVRQAPPGGRYLMFRLAARVAKAARTLPRMWHEAWEPPDALLLAEGAEGELALARIRLLGIAILSMPPLVTFMQGPADPERQLALVPAIVALVWATLVFRRVKRGPYVPSVGFTTTIADVTMVSLVLLLLLALDRPFLVVNSRVLYSAYFVAVAGASLRYDARIAMLGGLLAIAQYGGIVAYASTKWILNSPDFAPIADGTFDLTVHYVRLALLAFAALISTLVVRRAQALRWRSAKDGLTGLLSRGFFEERAHAEVSRTLRYKRDLSIALIDIDNFKRFNDEYGHSVGDEVLRLIGEMMQSVRQSDLVARWGGEEFIIVFPETSVGHAVDCAEKLRKKIASSMVTVSIGIAAMPDDGTDLGTVVDVADSRLYMAKQGGRNRVVGPGGGADGHDG